MRRYFRNLTLRTIWHLWRKLYPTPQHIPETATEAWLKQRLDALVGELGDPEKVARRNYAERCHELAEARQMMGSGPGCPRWRATFPIPARASPHNYASPPPSGSLSRRLRSWPRAARAISSWRCRTWRGAAR